MKEIRVIRKSDTSVFMEGKEFCRKYVEIENLTFGVSIVPVGERGAKDVGHPQSQELFFVIQGTGLIFVEESNNFYELHEGDAALIEKGVSHTLINTGNNPLIVSWSMSPSEKK